MFEAKPRLIHIRIGSMSKDPDLEHAIADFLKMRGFTLKDDGRVYRVHLDGYVTDMVFEEIDERMKR